MPSQDNEQYSDELLNGFMDYSARTRAASPSLRAQKEPERNSRGRGAAPASRPGSLTHGAAGSFSFLSQAGRTAGASARRRACTCDWGCREGRPFVLC